MAMDQRTDGTTPVPGATAPERRRPEGERAGTLAHRIAEDLRRDLLSGSIAPGQPLRMRELSERYDTSYSPIREALTKLKGEALVEYMPHRGMVAVGLDLGLLRDVYQARRLVEPELVRRAALRHTPADIEELAALSHELDALRARRKAAEAEWYEVHRAFHWKLIAPATNPVLRQTVEQWWTISERFHRAASALGPLGTPEARFVSHDTLVAHAADPDLIGYSLHQHLRVTEQTLCDYYARKASAEGKQG